MGTRALVKFKEGNKVIACLYRQFDGYPEGLGKELTELTQRLIVVNGFSSSMSLTTGYVNGIGCLTAYVISKLKTDIGNVYLMAPNTKDVGEEYVYTVSIDKNTNKVKIDCKGVTYD